MTNKESKDLANKIFKKKSILEKFFSKFSKKKYDIQKEDANAYGVKNLEKIEEKGRNITAQDLSKNIELRKSMFKIYKKNKKGRNKYGIPEDLYQKHKSKIREKLGDDY